MASPACDRAIEDALSTGCALLKYISANDVGLTGGHQCGYYLPKKVWNNFTPDPPKKGTNSNHPVEVLWPGGRVTPSVVKWYGKGTRCEYRLTRFGKDFPWLTADNLGNLLILVPLDLDHFVAHVLDLDEDIQEIQSTLGIEVIDSWAFYDREAEKPEPEDACINSRFRRFVAAVDEFPQGRVFSDSTRAAIVECVKGFEKFRADAKLVRLVKEEYELYKMVERKLRQPEIQKRFSSIDDFIETAQKILQARKSRAGRSLENHVEYLLREARIPFEMRQIVDDTRPDIIIPDKSSYDASNYPANRLFMVGVKTTCKDRWRQVTKEAPRIKRKHILTLQQGITSRQLKEMWQAEVVLVVPDSLHKEYPREFRPRLVSVQSFIDELHRMFPYD